MAPRAGLLLLVLSLALVSDDAPPRSKPSDYAAHVKISNLEIGAEYLMHSIPVEKGAYVAKEYLVIDVAVFPSTKDGVTVSNRQFTLRVDGNTKVLTAQAPGMVAAALKYPDWEPRPNLTAQAGPVVYGAPPLVGRFPGDPRDRSTQPRGPGPQVQLGPEREQQDSIDMAIVKAALPEGPTGKTVKGCVFFRFEGNAKSIRTLELTYDCGSGAPPAKIKLL